MKKYFFSFFVISIMLANCAYCQIWGNVKKQTQNTNRSKIIDSKTKEPIGNAKVRLPAKNFMVETDTNGEFDLNAQIKDKTIMSVEKRGYKPFSLTIDEHSKQQPFTIGIEKSKPYDIVLETDLCHIGDDVFSSNSANAQDFNVKAVGPFLTRNFMIKKVPKDKKCFLTIGSVIGIDTQLAKQMGQSKVKIAYSSPVEIFFNNKQIAELKINGDNQKIPIPNELIKIGQNNQITIKTGRNLFQTAYIDYDDIELMNVMIEFN